MLQARVAAQKPQKKKGNPPHEEMRCESSEFVNTIFGNLGPTAQTWYRDFKVSLGEQPATWAVNTIFDNSDPTAQTWYRYFKVSLGEQPATWATFKRCICERFREADNQHKLLSRLHNLRWSGSQHSYTTKFLHLLSQLDSELPEGKQQAQKKNSSASDKFQASANTADKKSDRSMCEYCDKPGHHEGICFKKKAVVKASAAKKLVGSVGLHYQTGEASNRKKEKLYGYLCHGARVDDASVSVFIDSGASFNVMAPEVAANLQLPVTTLPEPLRVKLGGGQCVSIPRSIATITLSMDGFPEYDTEAFVMEIPEGKNVMLGLPWLKDHDTFCFAVRICEETSDKAARQLSQGWDQLRGHPEEEVVVKYKNTVFRAELPNVAPRRSVDVEAEVELSNGTPVARKQFSLSDAMKVAIRAWTLEMLEAGIIRPSKSPYCAPTFCVKKAVGWQIFHDFRGINFKLRVPATPVPRKEDIFDAMAGCYYFSAMDLLWGFFQVRLREKEIQYTAFSTSDDQFEYLVTPMDLACISSVFNLMMKRVFSDQHSF
ncbi:hypothetical protein PHMEG_00014684 [Phytophthora megakarya]|uniref:Retrotransposon gag domain-containing protein n=1 Tax=Phytophthora megakarya TaxID=4795 RepID=A0A225W365_9STRA|nr:hypothetical protein PHMEG_00014684 [Phytophthora megakarya]